MPNCSLFTGEALPGPGNLDLMLGTGIDLQQLIDSTEETLDHYRFQYATEYGVVHSIDRIFIGMTKKQKDDPSEPQPYFARRVMFFRSKAELMKFTAKING